MGNDKRPSSELKLIKKISGPRMLVLVILLSIVLESMFLVVAYGSAQQKLRSDARTYAESVASSVEISLEQTITSTNLLKDLYLEYGDSFLNDFERICARLDDDSVAVGSMYIAPHGIIQYAYPSSINESTIGFNMLEDPEQSELAILAVDTGSVTVAGPHALVEGGTGFIVRNPIFVDGEFDAFSIIVLDWDEFVESILNKINNADSGYRFGVWKAGDIHAVTDEYGFIFKNCEGNISRDITVDINVPNDTWYLSIEPVNGMSIISLMVPIAFFSILVFLLIILFAYDRIKKSSSLLDVIEYDDLTHVYTKQAFYHYAGRLLSGAQDTAYDLVICDVENFKLINHTYGESKGDEVLRSLSQVYTEHMSGCGICARFSGDQFVMLYVSATDRKHQWLENLMSEAERRSGIGRINLKCGLYEKVDRSLSVSAMCDRALLAVKSIKHNYQLSIADYDGPVSQKHERNRFFESRFDEAIRNNEFVIYYQPKFDAMTEKLVSAEALVRWKMSDGTFIPPGEFIPAFEEDGLISRLDEYVFRKVCENIASWDSSIKHVPISVNLSRASLFREGLVSRYKSICGENGIPTWQVPIELTESSTLQNSRISELADEFKAAGFQLHMDDFGSGVSSLASFNMLPFDVLKLDKSLIDYIGEVSGEELLKVTISLAHFKKMEVVAEGVETREQLDFLREFGCDVIQGYYFSPPKPFAQCLDYFKKED